MANLSTIITGQTPLGGATEKNYVQASDAPGALWVASGAGVAVALETSVGNLPESTTKKSAIRILRASGTDYVRHRFIIDKVDGSKTFKIQWAQAYAGTTGDYTISVVAYTDSGYSIGATTLPVTTSNIPAVNGVWTVTFNTLSYATAPYIELRVNAVAGTTPLYISGVVVGPGITAQGAVISDWQTFTPTTNLSNTANLTGRYRRVGSDCEVTISHTMSGNGTTVQIIRYSTPTGLTVNTAALPLAAANWNDRGTVLFGVGEWYDASVSQAKSITVTPNSGSTSSIMLIPTHAVNDSAMAGNSWDSGDEISFSCKFPCAEWAGNGVVTLSSGAIVEYASNSSTTNGNDTTSFVSGSAGSLVPTITASAGTNRADKTVQFQYPIQSDDILIVEIQSGGSGPWLPVGDAVNYDKFHAENTNRIGVGILFNPTPTTVVVGFAHGGASGSGTYGSAGNSYPVSVGDRWRVRKAKASAPVGIDTSSLGGGSSGFDISVETSNFTAATLTHYLVDTSANAITATLPAGTASASIKFSDDQRTWSVRPLTITPATGERIDGQAINEQFICDVSGAAIQLSWDGVRWVLDSNVIQSTVSITTGNSLTEKNYVTRPDSAATDWSTSNGSQVTVTTETSTANLPENATKSTAIKVLRSAGTTSYVYTRFILDSVDASKKLKLQWNQKFAGASGDFTIALFSFTASDYSTGSTQLTTLQTATVPALASGSFTTTFDAPAASAPYIELRIIAAAGTTPLYLSGVLIGPGVTTQSAAVTYLGTYVPVFTSTGASNLGLNSSRNTLDIWRIGDSLKIQGTIQKDGNAPSGTVTNVLVMGLPSGLNSARVANSDYKYGTYSRYVTAYEDEQPIINVLGTGIGFANPTTTSARQAGSFAANSYWYIDMEVPIAEWAGSGTTNIGSGAQIEYVSHDGVTQSSTWALIPNIAGASGNTSYAITPQYPCQSDDVLEVEIRDPGNAVLSNGAYPWIQGSSSFQFGVQVRKQANGQILVIFGNAGFSPSSGIGAAATGNTWADFRTSGWTYRVRKAKASSPVGFGSAGWLDQGLVSLNQLNSSDLNVITYHSDARNWSSTGAGMTVATTQTAAELPLSNVIGTGIKITNVSGTSDEVRYDFTIPPSLRNRKLKLQWEQLVSSYASTDTTVDIKSYTDAARTTSELIYSLSSDTAGITYVPPANGKFFTAFDTDSREYYRLVIKRAAGTGYVVLANVVVGPGEMEQSAAISQWQSYTPTIANGGTTSLNSAKWRRVGSSMEISGIAKFTASGSAGNLTFSIPSGYTGDSSSIPGVFNDGVVSGAAAWFDAGTAEKPGASIMLSTTTIAIITDAGSTNVLQGSALANGDWVRYFIIVPISEWSGNGTVILGPGAQIEYAYSTDTTTTAGSTQADNGLYGYGPEGTAFVAVASSTANSVTSKRVRFQYPIQNDDLLSLEVQIASGEPWVNVAESGLARTLQARANFGMRVLRVPSSATDVYVEFGNSGATPGSGSAQVYETQNVDPWSNYTARRWRVRKANASAPVGIAAATTNTLGLVTLSQISGGAADLQEAYDGGATITTSGGTDVLIAGTEALSVTADGGVLVDTDGSNYIHLVPGSASEETLLIASSSSSFDTLRATASGTGRRAASMENAAAGAATLSLANTNSSGAILSLFNAAKTFTVSLVVPSSLAANYSLTLPLNDGNTGEFLQTNGSGTLTWAAAGGGGITYTEKTGAYTAVAGDYILANTSGGAFTVTLPATPSVGDAVIFFDARNTWATNNLTVGRNGENILGSASDLTADVDNSRLELVYVGGSIGWNVYSN